MIPNDVSFADADPYITANLLDLQTGKVKRLETRNRNITLSSSSQHVVSHSVRFKVRFDVVHFEVPTSTLSNEVAFLTGRISPQYRIIKRLPIKISLTEDGEFIGDMPDLEIYAFGSSRDEVLSEIREELIDLYETLAEENTLGRHPQRWKQILQQSVVRD